jgi:anti-sigma factor ChrR (cupin superfamily)
MFPRRSIGTNGHGSGGDPTKNVLDLVNAAIARVDDLRESETRHQTEVARLLTDRVESMMAAESHRIDAIRAVDVDAVQKAATAAAAQANVLAATQQATAEALRTQVADTATLAETRLAAALSPMVRDVAELQKRAWETAGGKTQIVETQAKGSAASNWMGLAVAGCVGILSLLLAVGAILISVLSHKP